MSLHHLLLLLLFTQPLGAAEHHVREVVANYCWGAGDHCFGLKAAQPERYDSVVPSAFQVADDGGFALLDDLNGRLVRLDARGRWLGSVKLALPKDREASLARGVDGGWIVAGRGNRLQAFDVALKPRPDYVLVGEDVGGRLQHCRVKDHALLFGFHQSHLIDLRQAKRPRAYQDPAWEVPAQAWPFLEGRFGELQALSGACRVTFPGQLLRVLQRPDLELINGQTAGIYPLGVDALGRILSAYFDEGEGEAVPASWLVVAWGPDGKEVARCRMDPDSFPMLENAPLADVGPDGQLYQFAVGKGGPSIVRWRALPPGQQPEGPTAARAWQRHLAGDFKGSLEDIKALLPHQARELSYGAARALRGLALLDRLLAGRMPRGFNEDYIHSDDEDDIVGGDYADPLACKLAAAAFKAGKKPYDSESLDKFTAQMTLQEKLWDDYQGPENSRPYPEALRVLPSAQRRLSWSKPLIPDVACKEPCGPVAVLLYQFDEPGRPGELADLSGRLIKAPQISWHLSMAYDAQALDALKDHPSKKAGLLFRAGDAYDAAQLREGKAPARVYVAPFYLPEGPTDLDLSPLQLAGLPDSIRVQPRRDRLQVVLLQARGGLQSQVDGAEDRYRATPLPQMTPLTRSGPPPVDLGATLERIDEGEERGVRWLDGSGKVRRVIPLPQFITGFQSAPALRALSPEQLLGAFKAPLLELLGQGPGIWISMQQTGLARLSRSGRLVAVQHRMRLVAGRRELKEETDLELIRFVERTEASDQEGRILDRFDRAVDANFEYQQKWLLVAADDGAAHYAYRDGDYVVLVAKGGKALYRYSAPGLQRASFEAGGLRLLYKGPGCAPACNELKPFP